MPRGIKLAGMYSLAAPPVVVAEEAGSEVSALENRKREEHLAQMEEEARLGGEG